MQKPFLTCHKRHNPRGFEILNFSIFLLYITSTQTTYFNKKLHKLRRLLVESDFPFVNVFTPCILLAVPRKTAVSRRYENDAQYSKQLSIKESCFSDWGSVPSGIVFLIGGLSPLEFPKELNWDLGSFC